MPLLPVHRVALGNWPTPVEPAPRLAEAVGLPADRLWLKRDDLIGLAAGGNKVRKLEWTVGRALAEGADVLITTGAAQSNHARLTAGAAARVGLRAVLVLSGSAGLLGQDTGNLLLDHLLGAEIVWVDPAPGDDGQAALDRRAAQVAAEVVAAGGRPAVIPYGGSDAVGAHGYRLAGAEITQQIPGVRHVVAAVGSGGTMAGLVAALGADRVLGVDTGAVTDPEAWVRSLLAAMGEDSEVALRVRHDQVGPGYSAATPEVEHALRTAARTEGLLLDPVYAGRALAGLTAAVRDGSVPRTDDVVLLVSGGLPGLFAHQSAAELGGHGRG